MINYDVITKIGPLQAHITFMVSVAVGYHKETLDALAAEANDTNIDTDSPGLLPCTAQVCARAHALVL